MSSEREIVKAKPPEDYPPEEGCYLRGNDYSPVAVVVILRWRLEETPPSIEALVRTAIESGAALAGTLQTENIGLEKVICNIVANPNIRYLVVCGPESEGHQVGQTIAALMANGIDDKRMIIGSKAQFPCLYNIPVEWVERFRHQLTLIDLINEDNPEVVREAVWSCYQEELVEFKGYRLHDPGAYPEPPLCAKITSWITQPWLEVVRARLRETSEAETGTRAEHFGHLADIAGTLVSGLVRVMESPIRGDKFKHTVWNGEAWSWMSEDQLIATLEANMEMARLQYGDRDFGYFLSHLKAEYPDIESWELRSSIREKPLRLIETLNRLTRRRTFAGTCPVCIDW